MEETKGDSSPRRNVLKKIGISTGTIFAGSQSVSANVDDLPNERQKQRRLKNRYDGRTADLIIKILKKHYPDFNSGNYQRLSIMIM